LLLVYLVMKIEECKCKNEANDNHIVFTQNFTNL